jgi:hypothetical protein
MLIVDIPPSCPKNRASITYNIIEIGGATIENRSDCLNGVYEKEHKFI